jgi:hypothetical protein
MPERVADPAERVASRIDTRPGGPTSTSYPDSGRGDTARQPVIDAVARGGSVGATMDSGSILVVKVL